MSAPVAMGEATPAPLSFADFLEKMKDPAAADLVRNIKGFIRHFDERSSKHIPNLDTDSAAVQDFFIRMEAMFRVHPAWRGANHEVIDQAIEGLEKYVMSKIWPRTFAASAEDRDRDARYSRLAQALSFVDLTTLMGVEVIPDENLVATAVEELVKMDRYKAPRDKLLCLVNVKTLVEDIVGEAVRRGASIGGADAFFPVFLLVVVHARLPRLASNIDYIRRFRARSRLTGQFDYMLCNLESAAMYFDTADWKHLGVTQDFFLKRLADAGIPEAAMELKALEEKEKSERNEGLEGVKGGEEGSLLDLSENEATGGDFEEEAGKVPTSASVSALAMSEQEGFATAQIAEPEQPLLSIDVPETLGGDAGTDLQSNAQINNNNTNAIPAATAGGLTPLGAGPQTPVLMKQRSTIETKQQEIQFKTQSSNRTAITPPPPPPSSSESTAHHIVQAMVADGTPLVLEEEAEGRLQQRHPWIYAAAEDLNIADVRSLLAEYRDLVLKYEALTLSLQQQVGQSGPSTLSTRGITNTNQGMLNATTGGSILSAAAQSSGGLTESAGALIQKLTSWGASRSPSGRHLLDGNSSEAAAALQGKAAAAATGGAGAGTTAAGVMDTRLLQSLFGAPSSQQTSTAPQRKEGKDSPLSTPQSQQQQQQEELPQLDLLGDLETEVKGEGSGGDGGNVSNDGGVGSPALGLIDQPQEPSGGMPESLI